MVGLYIIGYSLGFILGIIGINRCYHDNTLIGYVLIIISVIIITASIIINVITFVYKDLKNDLKKRHKILRETMMK